MSEIEDIWKGPVFFISHAIQTIGTHTQHEGHIGIPPPPLEHLDTTPVIERNAVETLLDPPRYRDTTPPPRSDSTKEIYCIYWTEERIYYGHLFQYRANGPYRYRAS